MLSLIKQNTFGILLFTTLIVCSAYAIKDLANHIEDRMHKEQCINSKVSIGIERKDIHFNGEVCLVGHNFYYTRGK